MSDAVQEWYSTPHPLPDAATPLNPHPAQTAPTAPSPTNIPPPPLISHPPPPIRSSPYHLSQPVASSTAQGFEANLSHRRNQSPAVAAPSMFPPQSSPVLSIAGFNRRPAQSTTASSVSSAPAGRSSDNDPSWYNFNNLSISDVTSTSVISHSVSDERAVARYVREIGSVVGIVYEGSPKDEPVQYEYPSKLGPRINEYLADHGYTQSAILAIDRIYEQSLNHGPADDYFVRVLASKKMEIGVARYIWKLAHEYEKF